MSFYYELSNRSKKEEYKTQVGELYGLRLFSNENIELNPKESYILNIGLKGVKMTRFIQSFIEDKVKITTRTGFHVVYDNEGIKGRHRHLKIGKNQFSMVVVPSDNLEDDWSFDSIRIYNPLDVSISLTTNTQIPFKIVSPTLEKFVFKCL